MIKVVILQIVSLSLLISYPCRSASAFWIWTPQTQKWVNPKYAVQSNPEEQLKFAQEIYEKGDYEKAMREFKKLLQRFPKSYQAPQAQFQIGDCLEKLNKPYEAFLAYQKVIDKYPLSDKSAEIIKRQYEIGESLIETKKRGFWKAFAGKEYPSVEIFRQVVKNSPYGEYAPRALYELGVFLMQTGRYEEASEEFNRLISQYPKEKKWVDLAKYQIAVCNASVSLEPDYDQERSLEASSGFEKFIERHPQSQRVDEAKQRLKELREKEAESNFKIAQFYEKQKAYDSARIYYRYIAEKFPETQLAPLAEEKLEILEKK